MSLCAVIAICMFMKEQFLALLFVSGKLLVYNCGESYAFNKKPQVYA